MKWYWIVLIVLASAAAGYWLAILMPSARRLSKSRPLKGPSYYCCLTEDQNGNCLSWGYSDKPCGGAIIIEFD